jgi:AraC-like DNA-binding protein
VSQLFAFKETDARLQAQSGGGKVRVIQLEQPFQRQSASELVRRSHVELFRRHTVAFRLRTSRLEVEPHAGNLSIKTVFSGAERYEFADRVAHVRPGQILFVKPDVHYASSIRSSGMTDSFSLFLPKPVLGKILGSRHIDSFLNSSLCCTSLPGLPRIASGLAKVAGALQHGDELGSETAMVELMVHSGADLEEVDAGAERLSAATARTRAELMRRVLLCRDMLHAHVENGVSLAELAQATCLSEFHLMRCFKQVFGVSISQYLVRLRMEEAARLLDAGRLAVTEIARRCGYADLSAFGRAFRRHWGCSATRRQQGAQREI